MEFMLKRLLAFLCTVVMLMAAIAAIPVSAARTLDCWSTVKVSEDMYFDEDGALVLDGMNGRTAKFSYAKLFSPEVTLKFSMKIDTNVVQGLNLYTGSGRAGFYINPTHLNPHGGGGVGSGIGYDWHDYKIIVQDNIQTIYIDNKLAGSRPCQDDKNMSAVEFWTNPNGKLRIGYWELTPHDGRKIRTKTSSYGGEWLPGEDYTPGFVQDWKTDSGNWYITDDPGVEWDREAGVLRFDGSKTTSGNYVPVQHALKLTQNFDWKWKWRILRNTNSMIQIKFYGDYLNLYFYITDNNVLRGAQLEENLKGETKTYGLGIAVEMGENLGDWCDMELKRRGEYLSLYVNGGKVKTWRAYASSDAMGMIAWSIEGSGIGNPNSDAFEVGETSYTPYFPVVEMVCPLYRSEYVQGTDVELQAKAEEEVDYIDYYVDDVKVGRGYAPNYSYILKNVQVGTYNVSAGVGNQRSAATVMTVKPAFTSTLNLSAEEVPYGGTLEASVNTVVRNDDTNAKSVDYYVDGDLVATSAAAPDFKVQLRNLKVGTSAIYAKVKNKQDVIQTTEYKLVDVYSDGKGEIVFDREYDMTYKYAGGTGKVEAEDGYFKLYVENNGNILKYLDSDGQVKEYSMTRFKDTVTGLGDYRIITTSGFAEVYYNGHMLHTFYMPRTENKNKLSYSGIENFRITGRGCKYTLFSEEWTGQAEYASDAINMGTIRPTNTQNVYSAVEFDKTDLSNEVFNFYDGRYHMQLRFENGDIYVREQGKYGEDVNENFKIEYPAEPGYYRVNLTEGVGQIWVNNKYLGGFVCPLYSHKPQIVRTMTDPSTSTIMAVKTVDDIYYHSEDFSGNKELVAHDYWITDRDVKATINKDEETGKYHTTITSGSEGRFYLNGYTKDINFKAKVKVDSAKDFYMMTRMHPIYYDFKLGYDFENKYFYAEYDVFGGNSKSIGSDRRTFAGDFELGVWHDIEVINDEKHLVMKVDGKTVIDTSDFWLVLAGNAGFGVVGGTLHFTDVEYEGRGKIGSGIYGVHDNEVAPYNDFLRMQDGRIVSFSDRGGARFTSDEGKTWTAPVSNATTGYGGLTNVLMTKDGNWVKISASGGFGHASVSKDEGATWESGTQLPKKHVADTTLNIQNNFSNVAKNGRLLVTSDELSSEESGKIGIWWSDDGGLTWEESDTFIEETLNNVNTQEACFVDMPEEGRYRIFARTDRNFIYFAESTDDCKTFDQYNMKPSPFKSTCTTFKIRRDINEDQTYYALWAYDVETSWQFSRNEPRNRVGLAVSYDGMKTWEYVQSVFDTSDFPNGLVRNYSMEILDDTICISMNGQANDCFLMTIDKNKIKTTKRFEEARPRGFWSGTVADEEAYTLSVIPNTSGQAWILGNYENVEVREGGFVDANAMAKAFKSTMEKSGNTVTFRIGEGYVKFTEGSTSFDVNGAVTDFGSVCMKDGFININACAKAFGKNITENQAKNGWVIWADDVYTAYYREQLEGLI